ncbi:MAG: Uncharacterised protein [Cryomorphaceae bacterium]|nr:MAG: Uncharacterised protein [Cryomorphaceae bacterium]
MNVMSIATKFKWCILAVLLLPWSARAQQTTKDSTRSVQLWGISAGGNVPLFDLSTRFNQFASVSVEYMRKNRAGWLYGGSFDAQYGTSVNDPKAIFGGLMDEDGNFIGVNGEFAYIQPGLSGGQFNLSLAKIIAPRYNANSGWLYQQSLGLSQNKIGLRDERGNFPQLQSPFLEGYDRLHRGISSTSTLRYLHLDNRERINYALNLYLNLGVSRSVRGFNIDTGLSDTSLKFDSFIGAGFTWFLPVYAQQESFFLLD